MLEGSGQILSNIELVLQAVIDQMGMGKKLVVVSNPASVSIELVKPIRWHEVGGSEPNVIKTVMVVEPVLQIGISERCTGVRNTPSLILTPYAGQKWTLTRNPAILSLCLYQETANVIGRLLGAIACHGNPQLGKLIDLHWIDVLVYSANTPPSTESGEGPSTE
ncbi:MAG: hypothetical protein WC773_02475 [Patescibacteria group bacterium]|jgi:hypothetical protein